MAAAPDLHPPHRIPDGIPAEEWAVRCDLAAAYRLCALYGWTDLNNTHISARVPGTGDDCSTPSACSSRRSPRRR